ncbi:MAG: hypothetical protein RBU23_03365 [Candidatus Auribacterota bacterium]|jgi:hypothetical protein|nr:hypothetical protein [Candidatus Auribacterota bacterium]
MRTYKLSACIAIVCLLTILPVYAQDNEGQMQPLKEFGTRYEYSKAGFSIVFPFGWKESEIGRDNVVCAAFSPPDRATGVSVNVVVAATELSAGEDLDSRFSNIMEELSNLGDMCSIVDTGSSHINELPSRIIVYKQTMEEHQFLARITVLVENGIEYRIGSFATPATYELFKSYFTDIESSFTLIPAENGSEQ